MGCTLYSPYFQVHKLDALTCALPTCVCGTSFVLDNLRICLHHLALAPPCPCTPPPTPFFPPPPPPWEWSSSGCCTFQTQANQSRVHTLNHLLCQGGSHTRGHTCHNHPRQLGTIPVPQAIFSSLPPPQPFLVCEPQ